VKHTEVVQKKAKDAEIVRERAEDAGVESEEVEDARGTPTGVAKAVTTIPVVQQPTARYIEKRTYDSYNSCRVSVKGGVEKG